ncbi:MAG: cytochrome d ubiquinol oxidase subunit II [Methylococcales bacterium]|nr:cytochrome d ubiquinol oxidase subunit II [Methylococcales bacterium]
MSLDYPSLRLLWWAILVLAVIGFALSEGLLLGVAMLLPQAGKTDGARKTIIAGLAGAALGLQAWLFAVAALLFAAWPVAYAVLFASLQPLLLLMIPAWISRIAGLFFRNSYDHPLWRQRWDKILTYGGFLLTVLLGIICGNLLKGIPFHFDSDMRIFFLGDFWGLLNPFSLLIAAFSIALFMLYGAAFLQLRYPGEISQSSRIWIYKAGAAFLVLFTLAGLWVSRLEGYHITSAIFPDAATNPLNKFVKRNEGLWLDNYEHLPSLAIIPALAFIGCGATLMLTRLERHYYAFLAATITLVFSVLTMAISMFPFLLPSNRSLNSSLTLWDASGSQNTLSALLWAAAIYLPLMAVMTRWAFRLRVETEIR